MSGAVPTEELLARVTLSELARELTVLRPAGRELTGLCPFHKESTPSFYVNDHKNVFRCYGCRAGGGVLEFIKLAYRTDLRGARRVLEERLHAGGSGDSPPAPARRRPAKDSPGDAERKSGAIAWALKRWGECHPGGCTDVETYLIGRGIDVDGLGGVPPTVRYHRGLRHAESGRTLAAMVCAVQMPDRRVCGIHRTFLETVRADEAGEAAGFLKAAGRSLKYGVVIKARVKSAKKMAGTSKGGAIRLAAAEGTLAVAEGVETALSVMQALGLPAWAAMSLGNMAELSLPEEVREVVLCADGDNKDKNAAESLLRRAVRAYEKQGVAVKVIRPPEGMDFNDVLRQGR